MTQPDWTVDEARHLRAQDGVRRARLHEVLGRRIQGLVQSGYSGASRVFGDGIYRPTLVRAARRMNRNCHTAFTGFTPQTSDIVCAAYFKAGTNWLLHVCYQIANLGEGEFDHIQDEIPWPDAAQPRYWRALNDVDSNLSSTGYRVIKSHLPANLVPVNGVGKYIAMTRDPVDCAASGYHFFAKLYFGPKTPPPDVWLDFFGTDEALWGTWHRFTASWWEMQQRDNVMFLRFESMKLQPEETIRNIAVFLGITLNDAQVALIAEKTSFAAMKKMNDKFYPVRQTIWSAPDGQLVRKGVVGDGVSLFSAPAIERFLASTSAGLNELNCNFPFYGVR